MRIPFIAGNWKMHMTRGEGRDLAIAISEGLKSESVRVMVAPPFTAIEAVAAAVQGSRLEVAGQNMAAERSGAHTGEISPLMLRDAGATCVILGHSERRHVYGESDALINQKVLLALEEGLDVILCVGETLDERDAGRVDEVNERQLQSGLAGVDASAMERVTIAYEPVWAIGTGRTATPDDAAAAHAAIRAVIAGTYDQTVADSTIIQYGGSVKSDNAAGLLGREDIDGALVGGASLKAQSFLPIVHAQA